MPNTNINRRVVLGNSSFWDADALTFLSTAGITNSGQMFAINDFVKALKVNGIWTKCDIIYPFIGGTSSTCSYNLKNPAQFQITWTGTPTFTGNGVGLNGTTAYGKTGYIPSINAVANNLGLHWYTRQDGGGANRVSFGVVVNATNQWRYMPRWNNSTPLSYATADNGSPGSIIGGITINDCAGLNSMSRLTSTSHTAYKGGRIINSNAGANIGSMPNIELYIGASNSAGTAAQFFWGETAFGAISKGLTDSECLVLNNLVEAYQSALTRATLEGRKITYEGNSFISNYRLDTYINTYLNSAGYPFTAPPLLAVSGSLISIVYGTGGYNDYMGFPARVAVVDARYDATAYKNIMVGFEGINELYAQASLYSNAVAVTNTYNSYVSYYTGRTALGFSCVFNTLTPRNNVGTPANYEACRQNASNKLDTNTINGLLRSKFDIQTSITRVFKSSDPLWANCYLVDVGDDPNFGQAGQYANPTYYQADLVHPTATMLNDMTNNYYGPCMKLI